MSSMDLTEKVKVSRTGSQIRLSSEHPDEVDYWEVGPAPDGNIFRSAIQAVRPPRAGCLPLELEFPSKSGDHPMTIRVVDIHGRTCSRQV